MEGVNRPNLRGGGAPFIDNGEEEIKIMQTRATLALKFHAYGLFTN